MSPFHCENTQIVYPTIPTHTVPFSGNVATEPNDSSSLVYEHHFSLLDIIGWMAVIWNMLFMKQTKKLTLQNRLRAASSLGICTH